MARLGDQLGEWLSRVELLARGAEGHRVEAERALASERPWEAREHALAVVDELPRSRVGLALWAEAAEATLLDNEAAEALERLAREVPFRADVWLRLAAAEERLGRDPRASLARAAEAGAPVAAADFARLRLADWDLARGDAARAERWVEQLGLGARVTPAADLRRLEIALARGDVAHASEIGKKLPPPETLDARAWLARARYLQSVSDPLAEPALVRALLLDPERALWAAAAEVEREPRAEARARLGAVVASVGLAAHPLWRAAYARAEGQSAEALAALADGARQSSGPELAVQFLDGAVEARDEAALAAATQLVEARGAALSPELGALTRALALSGTARLAELDAATGRAAAWAAELRSSLYSGWLPRGAPAAWRELVSELGHAARELASIDVLPDIEGIARDLERPLRVAVVGEFNAGKSSLINALLGEDVAPVGVLPTTATVNHLVWAPDRFARIERRDGDDRVVAHSELRRTLDELTPANVERVTLYAPLELLRKLELVDTPGFNAPDAAHAETARAAFRDAHVAWWLIDATQPLKQSERAVLEEIQKLGLPLFVLVNKIDRVGEGLAAALGHVEQGLADAALVPDAPIVAFSARLALAGRAGDGAALERSRWNEVEAFVEEVLVAKSATLRERALRRRAREVASLLAEKADARAEAVRARARELVAQRERLALVRSRLEPERASRTRALEAALPELVAPFLAEVNPVAGMVNEPAARHFVAQRARSALAPVLVSRAVELAELAPEDRATLTAQLRPRVEALASALGPRLAAPSQDDVRRELAELLGDEVGCALTAVLNERALPSEPAIVARAAALADALKTA